MTVCDDAGWYMMVYVMVDDDKNDGIWYGIGWYMIIYDGV